MALRILFSLALVFCAVGCGPRPVKIDNQAGRVSAIGPVIERDTGDWTLWFAIFDTEGNTVDVHAQWSSGDGPWSPLESCNTADPPCLRSQILGLSTRDNGHDKTHSVELDPGSLDLATAQFRMYALDDQSDAVIWAEAP